MRTTKQKTKLRLYVWTEFGPDYSNGLAFAIARDEADARKQIEECSDFHIHDWGVLQDYPLTQRIAKSVRGWS